MSGARGISRAGLSLALVLLSACSQSQPGKPVATGGTPLLDAFLVAYGKPAPYTTLDDSGDHVTYSPQALETVAPGVVALIAKGEIPGGCRKCGGSLSIYYLTRDASGYRRLGSWPDIGGTGEFGKALPWTLRTDIDNGPTLVTTRQEKDQFCSATLQELITLTPKQPVKIATVVVATAFAPELAGRAGIQVAGKVVPIERGKRFAVELSGSDTVHQVFTRRGDVFTTLDGGATGC
jgi:hypothetical protein